MGGCLLGPRLRPVKPHGGGYRGFDGGFDDGEAVRKVVEEKKSSQEDHLYCYPFQIAEKIWLEWIFRSKNFSFSF